MNFIFSLESKDDITYYDNIENTILAFIKNEFFPWVCLILLLNKTKNWKNSVTKILIIHWFLRSLGDALRNCSNLLPIPNSDDTKKTVWPYSRSRWIVGNAIAHIFWLSGEIVGDWYLYIRTKIVTNDKKKINLVLYCCIIYNIIKVCGILIYFIFIPDDFNLYDENNALKNTLLFFNIIWWFIVIFINITCFIYDCSVIYSLRTDLFYKLYQYKKYYKDSFMEKFKKISELRIFTTMGATLLTLPIIIVIVSFLISQYITETDLSHSFIDPEPIRKLPISLYYNLIYIDQILIKFYVNNNQDQDSYSKFITIECDQNDQS